MMLPLSPSNRNTALSHRRSRMLSSSPVQQPKKRTFSSLHDSPKKVSFQHPHVRSSSGPVAEPAASRVRLTSEPRPQPQQHSTYTSNSSSTTTIGTPARVGDRITKSWEALLPKAEGISPKSEMMFSTLNPFTDSPSPRPTAAALPTEIEYSSLQPSFDLGGATGEQVESVVIGGRDRFPFSGSWDSLVEGGGGSEMSELATPPMSLMQLDEIAGGTVEEEDGGLVGPFGDKSRGSGRSSFGGVDGKAELGQEPRSLSDPLGPTCKHAGDPFFLPRGRSAFPSPLLTHLSLPPPPISMQRTSSAPLVTTKHNLRPPHLSLALPSSDSFGPTFLLPMADEPLPTTPIDQIMTTPSCPPPLNYSPLHLGHSNPPSVEQNLPPSARPSFGFQPFTTKPFIPGHHRDLSSAMQRRDSIPHLILPDEYPSDSPPLTSVPLFANGSTFPSSSSAKSRMAALTSNDVVGLKKPYNKAKKPFPLSLDLAKNEASFVGAGEEVNNSPALHSPFTPEFVVAQEEGVGSVGLMPRRGPMERKGSLMWGGDETLPGSMRMEG